jgi:hypothetical protein
MAALLTVLVSVRYVRAVAVGRFSEDSWLYAALTLLAAQLGFVAIVYARPGIVAVVLWYAVPLVVLVTTAALVAFVRSWRTGRAPAGRQLTGYAALLIIVVSIAAFRIYPSAHDDVPSRVRFRVPLDFIAHLQQASITVRPGDRVSAGQSIGRVGNSSNSSEPQVHVHLQDRPTLSFGEAIPFYFHGYRLDGREVVRGMPRGGRTVRTRVRTGAFTGDIIEHSQARPSQATRAPRGPSSCLSRSTIAYTTSVAPEGPTPATRLCR